MALVTSYATLQSFALEMMDRAGVAADVAAAPTWIQLAESRLNRELPAVEKDTTLTGTEDSNVISISALSIVQPIALFLAESGRDEVLLDPTVEGTYPVSATSGRPSRWSIDGTNINFDRPLDSAYPFRFRYRERFALATTDPNWLLNEHPDVYIAATMMWGAGYHEDWASGQIWKAVLDEAIPAIRNTIAQSKRATLRVDPGLHPQRGFSMSDWTQGG